MNNGQESAGSGNNQKKAPKKNENKRKRRRQQAKQSPKQTPPATQAPKERKKKSSRTFAPVVVPKIKEPIPNCAICGKPIEGIAQAICGPEVGAYNHFDCVLRKIADDEHILPTQKVSYIGKGVFAIIDTDEEGKFIFVKRIPFETPETFAAMKRFVEEQKK